MSRAIWCSPVSKHLSCTINKSVVGHGDANELKGNVQGNFSHVLRCCDQRAKSTTLVNIILFDISWSIDLITQLIEKVLLWLEVDFNIGYSMFEESKRSQLKLKFLIAVY